MFCKYRYHLLSSHYSSLLKRSKDWVACHCCGVQDTSLRPLASPSMSVLGFLILIATLLHLQSNKTCLIHYCYHNLGEESRILVWREHTHHSIQIIYLQIKCHLRMWKTQVNECFRLNEDTNAILCREQTLILCSADIQWWFNESVFWVITLL